MVMKNDDARYVLGSVMNHVILHQTVVGEETLRQLEMTGDYPDVVIGCFGGGSNFGGIAFPFLRENLLNGRKTRLVAAEPTSCPKLTRGTVQYDFGDVSGLTPLLPMYTLGHDFHPADIHAGGLRYHGAGTIASQLIRDGLIEAIDIAQVESLTAGLLFANTEGIIPAPESTHAIYAAIKEAEKAKEAGEDRTIVFNLSGHGMIDLYAYEQLLSGALKNYDLTDAEIAKTVSTLEKVI
jgi:tryptophan synthase beta chain